MKHVLAALVFGVSTLALAQSAPADNPLDISKYKDISSASSLPTPASVTTLKTNAQALVTADKCADALPVLEAWAQQANWMANLVTAGLQPFYSSSANDRRSLDLKAYDVLTPMERMSNEYKDERNLASVMRAECLVKLNRPGEAAAVYARALDLISLTNRPMWLRATNGLYRLIGLSPINF